MAAALASSREARRTGRGEKDVSLTARPAEGGVQSVHRALDVLEALAAAGGTASLGDLAAACGFSPPAPPPPGGARGGTRGRPAGPCGGCPPAGTASAPALSRLARTRTRCSVGGHCRCCAGSPS